MGKEVLPDPIIFGPNAPQLRFRLVGGQQVVYSLTNFNLYPGAVHLVELGPGKAKTLTISSLLHSREHPPDLPVPKEFQLPSCRSCNKTQACRMIVDSIDEEYQDRVMLKRINIRPTAELDRCPVLAALFSCTQSEAERTFARQYYESALNTVPAMCKRFADLWCKSQFKLQPCNKDPRRLTEVLTRYFVAPALIPQVWLNYTYNPQMKSQGTEYATEKGMSRLDFLIFVAGERHIIEIDGPSHYARFNEEKQLYEVDEELYANNLRVQRALTSDGWHTHRFGRWEVMREEDILDQFILETGIVLHYCQDWNFEWSEFDLLGEMENEAKHSLDFPHPFWYRTNLCK